MLARIGAVIVWVGRVTGFLIGLVVIANLFLAPLGNGLAAAGDPLKIGQLNNDAQNRLTRLTAKVASAVLRLHNEGTGAALDLRVAEGQAPLKVNSRGKVANLNADLFDGLNSALFVTEETPIYEVRESGSTGGGRVLTALCDAGDLLEAGGFDVLSPNGSISVNHPVNPAESAVRGWKVQVNKVSGANDASVDVVAICYDLPPFHQE